MLIYDLFTSFPVFQLLCSLDVKLMLWTPFGTYFNINKILQAAELPYATTAFCPPKFHKSNEYTNWFVNSFSFPH